MTRLAIRPWEMVRSTCPLVDERAGPFSIRGERPDHLTHRHAECQSDFRTPARWSTASLPNCGQGKRMAPRKIPGSRIGRGTPLHYSTGIAGFGGREIGGEWTGDRGASARRHALRGGRGRGPDRRGTARAIRRGRGEAGRAGVRGPGRAARADGPPRLPRGAGRRARGPGRLPGDLPDPGPPRGVDPTAGVGGRLAPRRRPPRRLVRPLRFGTGTRPRAGGGPGRRALRSARPTGRSETSSTSSGPNSRRGTAPASSSPARATSVPRGRGRPR